MRFLTFRDQISELKPHRSTSAAGILLLSLLLVGYTLLIIAFATTQSEAAFLEVFSEEGVFERGALMAWLTLGILVICQIRSEPRRAVVLAVLFFLCAAREGDFQKRLTTTSIVKTSFYLNPNVAVNTKIISFFVVAVFICSAVYAVSEAYRYLIQKQKWQCFSGHSLITALMLFVVSKALDRIPAILSQILPLNLNDTLFRCSVSLEEGFELMSPLLLIVSAVWGFREGRSPSPVIVGHVGSDVGETHRESLTTSRGLALARLSGDVQREQSGLKGAA
jgi:hypothetical protein